MRKMTLLEMTQAILSDMSDDEVNSISDTVSSLQVAEIIKNTYYAEFNNTRVPEKDRLIKLEGLGDVTRPNYLKIPDNVVKIHWVRYKDYDNDNLYQELIYLEPEEFLRRQLSVRSTDSDAVATIDPVSLVTYYIRNNATPRYYTIFDDQHLVFDSFDAAYEATMQNSNSLAWGKVTEDFLMQDDYIPPIDGNLFPLLLHEAKSVAFHDLKQMPNGKAEQTARRQRIKWQNDKFRTQKAERAYWERGVDYSFKW